MNKTEQKNYLQSQSAYQPFFRLPETPMTKKPRTKHGSAITTTPMPDAEDRKIYNKLAPLCPVCSEQGRPRLSRKQDAQSPKLGSTLLRTFGIACHCRGRSAYPASNSSKLATLPRQFLGPSSPKKTQKFQSNVIRIVPLNPIQLSDLHHLPHPHSPRAEPQLGAAADAISKERQNVASMRFTHLHQTLHQYAGHFSNPWIRSGRPQFLGD